VVCDGWCVYLGHGVCFEEMRKQHAGLEGIFTLASKIFWTRKSFEIMLGGESSRLNVLYSGIEVDFG